MDERTPEWPLAARFRTFSELAAAPLHAPVVKSRSRNPRLIIKCVLVSDFDFHLPPELIAQHPAAERAASRLLHLRCNAQEFSYERSPDAGFSDTVFSEATFLSQSIEDLHFRDFPGLLRPTDLLVFNDTKVLPARLFGRRSGQKAQPLSPANPASKDFLQGRVEVLLTRRLPGAEETWQALVRPGRKIMPGERLYFFEGEAAEPLLEAEVPETALVVPVQQSLPSLLLSAASRRILDKPRVLQRQSQLDHRVETARVEFLLADS